MRRKAIPTGFPWLVIRPAGVDEYATEADARADANGGTVVHKSAAAAAPDLLAVVRMVAGNGIPGPMPHFPPANLASAERLAEIVDAARAAIARATGGAK